MKIALFGASGMIGSRILSEAISRGHEVVAIVRKPAAVKAAPGVTAVAGDVLDPASIAAAAAGADVAVSAFGPQIGRDDDLPKSAHALIAGLTQAGVPRVIVIGGAGSLEVAPGKLLIDTPRFPVMFKARARAQHAQLDILRAQTNPAVAWTFVSPSAMIGPGKRTGSYRLGGDQLLIGPDGESKVSAEDYAIAIVDEAEKAAHPNQRITVGS